MTIRDKFTNCIIISQNGLHQTLSHHLYNPFNEKDELSHISK